LAMDVLGGSPHAAMMLAAGGEAAAGAAAAAAVAAAAARDGGGPAAPSPAIPPRHQAAVARLRGFLQGLVSDLEAAVEYYALAEFNNWLMGVRSESRAVGLRAIRQAAIARQLGEDLAAERRKVAAGLMAVRDVGAVATRTVVGAAFRRELEAEGAPAPAGAGLGGPGGSRSLGKGSSSRGAAAAAAAAATGPPPDIATLHPGQPLQVTGFFVVEDAVLSAAPDLLPSPDAAALLWEAAAGSLRGVLRRALEEALGGTAPASIMLLLKDFMLLVCSALSERGFATGLLTELLAASRPRYHDLLTASVALRVGRALADDPLAEGHLVGSGAVAEELAGRLGLPASLEGGWGYHGAASSSAVLSALRAVQDGGERGLLRLLSGRVEALVEGGGRGLVWLPPGPLPPGNSPHVDELLALLRDTFDSAAATLPRPSFLFLARAVVRAMGNAFMHLMREGVKAYNLFAVERLAADCGALDRLVGSLPVPNLAAEFAEPRQLCALLLSPKARGAGAREGVRPGAGRGSGRQNGPRPRRGTGGSAPSSTTLRGRVRTPPALATFGD
ncbi:putative exocyst complex component 6, partial [Tetrabaena socialis]